MKKKKIIFILSSPSVGGAERQSLMVADFLAKEHQCNIEYWNFEEPDDLLKNEINKRGYSCKKVFYPGSINPLKQKIKLQFLIFKFRLAKPDILMPYLIVPNVFCSLVWRQTGAKACFWNQRDEGILNFEYNPDYFKDALQNPSCFISNSEGGKRFLEKNGADKSKIVIIHNAIETSRGKQTGTNEFENYRQKHDFIACMIANIHKNKDHHTLIKAWKIVCDELKTQGMNPLLLLAGKKYLLEEIKRQVASLEVDDHVEFTGFTEHIDQLLEISTIVVHSSNSEGTSNSILEAMAASKAIVATDIPSLRNTVSPENFIFLNSPHDYKQMAASILELAKNREKRNSVGKSNFEFVNKKFSMERFYLALENIFGSLLK